MTPLLLFDYTRSFSEKARAIIIGIASAALAYAVINRFMADPSDQDGMKVFGSYWASGLAWAKQLDPYGIYPETWRLDLGGMHFVDLNLNPPILLPLFRAFAAFELATGARLWALASALLALVTAEILLRGRTDLQKRQILWLFAAPALSESIVLGQVYVILFLISALAWLALRQKRFRTAGLAIGLLVSIKPIFALWPVYLFVAGHRRPAVVSGLAVASLSIVAVSVFGIELHRDWLAALKSDGHAMIPTDASLQGYFGRIGLSAFGPVVAALLVSLTLVWTWRRRPSALDASGIGLAVALLASPLAWFHYVLVLFPALMERRWDRTLTAAAMLLCVPVVVPLTVTNGPIWANAIFGGFYVGGVALILAAFLNRQSASARTAEPALTGEAAAAGQAA